MAKLIRTDGRTADVFPADRSKGFSNETIRSLIGCRTIEVVWLRGRLMLVDEDGKSMKHPVVNDEATRIAHEDMAIGFSDHIVGDVLVCSFEEYQ